MHVSGFTEKPSISNFGGTFSNSISSRKVYASCTISYSIMIIISAELPARVISPESTYTVMAEKSSNTAASIYISARPDMISLTKILSKVSPQSGFCLTFGSAEMKGPEPSSYLMVFYDFSKPKLVNLHKNSSM